MEVNNYTKAFQIKEYRYFISARLVFVFGLRMLGTAILFQMYQLTKSTYFVGIAGLIEFIPVLITAVFAGSYVDKHNKKNILIYAYASFLICGIALFITQYFTDDKKILFLFIIIFITGIIRSFAGPASNGMIAAIVPKNLLAQATGFNSQAWLIASVLGHAMGGFIIALLGMKLVYILVALLFAIGCLLATQLKSKPPQAAAIQQPIFLSIKEGFQYVWHNKSLLGVMTLDLLAVFFGGAVAFIPEISEKILKVGPIGFSWLNASMDLGALLSIIILTMYPMKKSQGLKMLYAVFVFGICIILFAFSKIYLLSFFLLLIAGFADGLSVVVRGVIMQTQTPDHLRGRVSSINSIFINSSNELGQFESGLSSKLLGTQKAIVFGGVMTLLVVLGIGKLFPDLKKATY